MREIISAKLITKVVRKAVSFVNVTSDFQILLKTLLAIKDAPTRLTARPVRMMNVNVVSLDCMV